MRGLRSTIGAAPRRGRPYGSGGECDADLRGGEAHAFAGKCVGTRFPDTATRRR